MVEENAGRLIVQQVIALNLTIQSLQRRICFGYFTSGLEETGPCFTLFYFGHILMSYSSSVALLQQT